MFTIIFITIVVMWVVGIIYLVYRQERRELEDDK